MCGEAEVYYNEGEEMRSSEKQKQIDSIPEYRLFDLKINKKSGQVNFPYKDIKKLWKSCIVQKGIVKYWIYDRSGKLIKKGVENGKNR
jgi:hypothetical protein